MTNILSVILIILSGLIFFLQIDPIYLGKRNIDSDKKTIEDIGIKDLNKRIKVLKGAEENIKKINERTKEILDDLRFVTTTGDNPKKYQKLNNMLPGEMEAAKLIYIIDQIQKKGRSYELISDISLDMENDKKKKRKSNGAINIQEMKNYKTVKLSFNFTSDYENFILFLDNLYHSDRLIDIVSINATRAEDVKKENIIDKMVYNFVIRTY